MTDLIIEDFTKKCNRYGYTSLYDLIEDVPYFYENGYYLFWIDSFGDYYDSTTEINIEIICNYITKTCNINMNINFRNPGCGCCPLESNIDVNKVAKSIDVDQIDFNISFNDIESHIYSKFREKGNKATFESFNCRIIKLNE